MLILALLLGFLKKVNTDIFATNSHSGEKEDRTKKFKHLPSYKQH